jgi:hypothetical protein
MVPSMWTGIGIVAAIAVVFVVGLNVGMWALARAFGLHEVSWLKKPKP